MRILFTLLVPVFGLLSSSFAQTWVQKASLLGNARYGPISFVIDDMAYVGLGGNGSSLYTDLWKYDPAGNSWTQMANFSGAGRRVSFVFASDSIGYVGAGWTGSQALYDFYAYNPNTNSWTQKTTYPGQGGRNCLATGFNGRGYVGAGNSSTGSTQHDDFWEYNPATDQWTTLGTFPFGVRAGGIACTVDSLLYFGMGMDGTNDFNDIWAYNPASGSWNQKASFPGVGRLQATCFAANGKIIAGGGFRLNSGTVQNDYYSYDPVSNVWTAIPGFSAGARSVSTGFTIGSTGYIAAGNDSLDTPLNDLWAFEILTSTHPVNSTDGLAAKIFPVPATDRAVFEFPSPENDWQLDFFDLNGKCEKTFEVTKTRSSVALDLSGFAAGIYFVRFSDGERTFSMKLPIVR